MPRTAEVPERSPYEILTHRTGTFAARGIQGPLLRNVGLEHVPADFYQLRRGKDKIHLVVMGSPLAGEALNNLLAAVAPSRPRFTNMEGTIADLYYITRNRDLHRDHVTSDEVGNQYTEFYGWHRKPFQDALEGMPNDINDLHHAAMNTRFIDIETFGHAYVQEKLIEIAHELRKEGFPEEKFDEEINRRERITTDGEIGSRYMHAVGETDRATNGRVWLTFTDFLASHKDDPIVTRALTKYALRKAHKKNITLVDTTTGTVYPAGWYGYSGTDGEGQVATVRRETTPLPTEEIEYSKIFQGQRISIKVAQAGETNEPGNVRIVEANIPSEMIPSAALTPVIAYKITATGERKSLTQKELTALVQQTGILPPHLHPDVSLGRVVLANFSPRVADEMARHMRLHAEGTGQDIMEAQTPTAYHVFERFLLTPDNPVIAVIESTP